MDAPKDRLIDSREACAAFDFSEAHLRRLIQWGALIPSGGRGRGNSRLLSYSDISHIGIVGALNRIGLSLQMAHTIAAFLPAEPSKLLYQPDALFHLKHPNMLLEFYDAKAPNVGTFPKVTLKIYDSRIVVWDSYVDYFVLGGYWMAARASGSSPAIVLDDENDLTVSYKNPAYCCTRSGTTVARDRTSTGSFRRRSTKGSST